MDDVTISGGGPGGLLTGLILARAGVRVRLFERAVFPRDKLCGDTLNPGALASLARHVDVATLRAMSLPITGMLLTGPRGAMVSGHYAPGTAGRAIVRRDFDQWLAGQAAAAGVVIEAERGVIAPMLAGRRIEGLRVRSARGREQTSPSRIAIGADGRGSRLAFGLGLARYRAQRQRWAIGAYFEGVADVGAMGEMHVRSGRYLGIAPTPSGLTNVCYVTSPDVEPGPWREPAALISSMVLGDPLLAPRFVKARRLTAASVLGPLAVDVPVPGAPGLLLTGDAAGFIDPMTGDGLRFAIEGAALTAAVTLDVRDGRIGYEAAPFELARRRQACFSTKWRFNRAVRRLVDHSYGIAGAALAARLLPGLFARMIRYAGDCDVAPAEPPRGEPRQHRISQADSRV